MTESTLRYVRRIVQAIWVIYAVALFIGTHIPVPEYLEETVSLYDKLIHTAAYLGLGVLTFLVFSWKEQLQTPSVWTWLGLLIYGAIDEVLQGFVGRTPDVADWCCDAAGISLAFLLIWIGVKWLKSRSHCGFSSKFDPPAMSSPGT